MLIDAAVTVAVVAVDAVGCNNDMLNVCLMMVVVVVVVVTCVIDCLVSYKGRLWWPVGYKVCFPVTL